ncbi:MAG: flagellar basal body-associated FliL family protein [Pseudomonadota bacterium]
MAGEIVEDKGEGAAPAAPAAKSKKKLFILGGAAAVLVLGGGGGAYALMSGGAKTEAHGEEAAAEAPADHGGGESGGHGGESESFVDVPPMVVNLRSPDGAARFLKLHFMIVPGPKGTQEAIKGQLPAVLDAYQPFLRELRPEDLAGSAAIFRIKEAMLARANDVLGPDMVKDILIQDLIQQ